MVPYLACCDADGNVTEEALQEAAEMAKKAKIAVVVTGLPDSFESEGFDRENMKMPEGHNRMIERVSAANPNTVVVLLGGSAMELPWFDEVKAILYMGLCGSVSVGNRTSEGAGNYSVSVEGGSAGEAGGGIISHSESVEGGSASGAGGDMLLSILRYSS